MTEKYLENKIKKYLTSINAFWFKVHGSSFMVSGLPDIVVCLNGRFIGIEVKRPDGKGIQSDVQKVQEESIKRAGGIYILADDFEETKRRLIEYEHTIDR